MEIEDSNLLTLYQIPPLCQDLEPAFQFIREQIKNGLRCTIMVKRPVDISARVQAAMEKRRKNLEKLKSPEELLAEKRQEVQQLIEKAEQAKEDGDYIKSIQNLFMALNINPEEDKQVKGQIMIKTCFTYELLDEIQQLIEYQDKTILLLKEENIFPEDLKLIILSKLKRIKKAADELMQSQQYENAIENYDQVKELSKQTDLPPNDLVDIQLSLGFCDEKLKKYDKAILQLEEILTEDPLLLQRKTNQLGRVYYQKQEYDRSISYYVECISLLEQQQNDQILLEKLLNKVGLLYVQILKNSEALKYLEKSCKLAKKILSEIKIAGRMHTLGEIQRMNKQWESALESYTVSMNFRKQSGDSNSLQLAKTQSQLSSILMQIKKYEPAKDMIKDTLKIYQDYQDQNNDVKLSIASLQIQLSDCYKEIGEPEGGIILLQKCSATRKKILGLENQQTQQAYLNLISLFFLLGEQEKSLELLIELKNSQENSQNKNNKLVGQLYLNIAIVQQKNKQLEDAFENGQKALGIFKKHAGVTDEAYIKCKAKLEEIKKERQKSMQQ